MTQPRFSLKTILIIITFTILLFCLVLNLGAVWGVVCDVLALFAPVTIGLGLAFILNVPMRALEEKVFAFMRRSRYRFVQKLVRPLALILSILLLLSVLTLLVVVVLPDLRDTVITLAGKLPTYFNDAKAWLIRFMTQFEMDTEWVEDFTVDWKMISSSILSFLQSDDSASLIGGAASWATSIGGGLMNTLFSVVIAIYFLAMKERICAFARRFVQAFAPKKLATWIFYVAELSEYVFSSFIRSQCIEAVILGLLSFIGLVIFRFEYAGIISIVIGFTALVPIVGALAGELFGAVLLLTVSPLRAIVFLIFILVLQQLEGSLIYPKVVGTSVGLPGIIVFSAVLIGGNAFGIPGALFAVPVCAVIFTLLKEAMNKRLKRDLRPDIPVPDTENL